jgi:4-hydroxy-2,2'-bipyrrole-5-carbaldehyde O-methyltransferase
MGARRVQLGGLLRTARAGHAPARALAIADSRALVRSLFLASAVRTGLLDALADGATFAEIAARVGCTRPERLRAWLEVGSELGEVARRSGRYRLRGIRARAIAGGDTLLDAHYRSMLDYQAGCYADLAGLLVSAPSEGRADLDDFADDIARVSLAATPFIETYLTGVMARTRPARVLDVGCGTGVYSRIVANLSPHVLVDGIDLASAVIDAARAEARAAGLDARIRLQAGDIRTWTPAAGVGYDLILLLNNIYYFPREERAALYRRLGGLLTRPGHLVVATLAAPGSVAAAHLNFMLACQAGAAALPRGGELEADLVEAGFAGIHAEPIVPAEPFLAVRAVLR